MFFKCYLRSRKLNEEIKELRKKPSILIIKRTFLGEEGTKQLKKTSEMGSTAVILDANLSLCTPNRLWLSSELLIESN